MTHIVSTTSYGQQVEAIATLLRAHELTFWREEAKRLREQLEGIAQAAIKGEQVLIHHQGKQVKLVPENTALRMSGDIP